MAEHFIFYVGQESDAKPKIRGFLDDVAKNIYIYDDCGGKVLFTIGGCCPSGIGIGVEVSLDLSDTTIYNVATTTLTIPVTKKYADIYNLYADLYSIFTVYAINNIIVSDGSSGGVVGKFYKSLTNGNTGNLLSDATNWAFADLLGGNVGNVEIVSFTNPMSLSLLHNSQFQTESGTSVVFLPTPPAIIITGQIMLPINTPITIVGRNTIDDIVSFNVQNNIARLVGMSVN